MLVVDKRERQLVQMLEKGPVPHETRTLSVGDILYEEGGQPRWVAERKRADDLASSIKSGRWHEQQARLFGSGLPVLFLIEGDLRGTTMPFKSLLAATVNAALRRGAHVFRTWDMTETAQLLPVLVEKMEAPHGIPSGMSPPLLGKRQRDEDTDFCSLRMLRCVPSISEGIARKLLEHFGSLGSLHQALGSGEEFPAIALDARHSLGKKRIAKLREVFVGKPAAVKDAAHEE